MSRHGGYEYCIFGKKSLPDENFMQAAALLQMFLNGNVANSGPSLLTWVAFVSGATR